MNEKIIIRDIEENDANQYRELINILDLENEFMIRQPGEFNKSIDMIEVEITNIRKQNKYFRVLEKDGKIIGYSKLDRSNKSRLSHKAEYTIGIIKLESGKGYGSQMLSDCIEWCEINGIERLDLKVAVINNSAIGLYKKFGFNQNGYFEKDLKITNERYLDFLHMSRAIEKRQ